MRGEGELRLVGLREEAALGDGPDADAAVVAGHRQPPRVERVEAKVHHVAPVDQHWRHLSDNCEIEMLLTYRTKLKLTHPVCDAAGLPGLEDGDLAAGPGQGDGDAIGVGVEKVALGRNRPAINISSQCLICWC